MSGAGGRHRKPETGAVDDAEDVLGEPPVEHEGPRHSAAPSALRSPWNRRRDRVVAASIAAVCLAASLVVWLTSDQRATGAQTAAPPKGLPPAPDAVPGSLTEMWRAPSAATPEPLAEGPTVVTGSGGEVLGRDPLTGDVRWRYARDLPLCTVGTAWSKAIAVYRKGEFCSEVTALEADTGRRSAQRNDNAELGTRLLTDGAHVTATGRQLIDTWRSDLVLTMEYGRVPALKNPDKQPRTGCSYGSVAVSTGRVGVIERCPGEDTDRLTVLKAVPEDNDKPEPVFSVPVAGRSAKVIAMSGESTAVVLPERKLLVIYGEDGSQRSAYPLQVPEADLLADPPGHAVATSEGEANVYWHTGSATMALAKSNLAPQWTIRGALGPGTMFAGQYVVPIKGGLAVLDERTGATIRTVGVDRRGYDGPVRLSATGPILLEQRGETITALR